MNEKMVHESELNYLLSMLFEYCMEKGNQEVWEIIFPYMQSRILQIVPDYIKKKQSESDE
jgi:hypothetical protein